MRLINLLARTLFAFALMCSLAGNSLLYAADDSVIADASAEQTDVLQVPQTLASPRATMATFIHAMNDIKRGDAAAIDTAISTLDLSLINSLVRSERGEALAWMLLEVIDRTRVVDLDKVPDRSQGAPWVLQRYQQGTVQISQQQNGSWLFDQQTIAALPKLIIELEGEKRLVGDDADTGYLPLHMRFRSQLPAVMKRSSFLLENWHWIALLMIVAVGVVIDWIISLILRIMVRRWRAGHEHFGDLPENVLRPLGIMAMALVWWSGVNLLGLPEQALLVLLVAVKFLASISGVWTAYRLVDVLAVWLTDRALATDNKIDDVLAPLIPRTLKIFVTVIGIVFIADNLNLDVTGLLAGLGLGGLAFALAAKDMVQNLFGSVTVLLDRTFTVGDWIVVGGNEGTVERIGFRSTRIRTFYNSVLTVPNSTFITANVDNMGDRRYRRLSTKLALTYDTPPEKIEAFCEGVRELVRQHPYMRKDYYHVYFNGYGDSALEILVYVFWETPDWSTELRERHRFLLDCLRLAKEMDVEFAFPTQTLYMKKVEDLPATVNGERDELVQQGRQTARNIVASTTGVGIKPPPVTFD